MTDPGGGTLASQIRRRLLAVLCGCGLGPWKVDVSRNFRSVTLHAQVHSNGGRRR